jgi:dTDP-4-dehydrorhamnose reductase
MADQTQRIVVVGAGGRLGATLMREYRDKFELAGFDHEDLDLANEKEVRASIEPLEFDVLVNAAAFTNVDLSETKRDDAFQVNATAPKVLAEICSGKGAKLIHFSTDYVFDGEKREPYNEEDPAHPISVYGESKRAGESNVLEADDNHLVIRVSWVFGPARPSFIDAMIKRAREEDQIAAVADKFSAPTYTRDIAEMLPTFFDRAVGGILHFSNAGQCSWQEYAQHALDCCRSLSIPLKAKTVGPVRMADMMAVGQTASPVRTWIARRPPHSVLSTAKYNALTGRTPRSWRDALADYIEQTYSQK